jgi:hypothetical protein
MFQSLLKSSAGDVANLAIFSVCALKNRKFVALFVWETIHWHVASSRCAFGATSRGTWQKIARMHL